MKYKYTFIVSKNSCNIRLDKFLVTKITIISRVEAKSLILTKHLLVNGVFVIDPNYRLKKNDTVFLFLYKSINKFRSYNFPLSIVYEDDYLSVINKPSGLLVYSNNVNYKNTLVNVLLYYFSKLSDIAGKYRLGIVHRLDKHTSGLMIIAKNNNTHFLLSRQISQRNIKKIYHVLVHNVPLPKMSTIRSYIDISKHDRTKMVVSYQGKLAVTHYKVLSTYENYKFSLVECIIETGRTHQIRVHMRYKNCSVVGDTKYSDYSNVDQLRSPIFKKLSFFCRHALHSKELLFIHPHSKKLLRLSCSLSDDIFNCLRYLRED